MQGKKWSTPERDERVIELYAQYESAIKVAEMVGCGRTTVNNIFVKYGIPRIGRRHGNGKKRKPKPEPKVKNSHCRSKYCPALIVMLYRCMSYRAKEIADVTGYQKNGVQNVLSKRGLTNAKSRPKKSDFDLDQIEYEYVALGMTTYELGEKYGVHNETIGGWMRERGIHFGKGGHQRTVKKTGHNESHRRLHRRAEEEFAKRLIDEFDGKFEYVGDFRANDKKFATIRCTECGHVFDHSIDFNGSIWTCPQCRQRQIEADRKRREEESEARRYERMFEEIREYALDKTCKECGSTFHSANKTALYCSGRCRNKRRFTSDNFRHYYHVKYGERYRDHYDPSISLKKLYERDGGVCQICGDPCDWDDREWGSNGPTYPSLDHIIPRSKGGDHKWENVQLAHCICNSIKGSTYGEVVNDVKLAG